MKSINHRDSTPLYLSPLALSQEILSVKSSLDFGAKCLRDS